jgi:hypothetical protein
MTPEELRDCLHQKPFEPFRIVLTDGAAYDVRHPDLMMVGKRVAFVGLTGDPGQTFFERTVRIDLLHISRIEPLDGSSTSPKNGAAPS